MSTARQEPQVPARQGPMAWLRILNRGFRGAHAQPAQERTHRVEVRIVHPLFERNDRVIGDVDVLWAHLGAALRDVAVADPGLPLQQRAAIEDVLGVHLQARDPDHEPWTLESALQIVGSQDMADVLAEEALDAFTELHHALNVLLLHPPGLAAREIFLAGRKRWYFLVDLVVPADVGHEVFDHREGFHRSNAQPATVLCDRRLAHEARKAVYLGRAGSAFGRLAVPAHGKIGGHVRLDPKHRVEDDHALAYRDAVGNQLTAPGVAAPDFEIEVRDLHLLDLLGGVARVGTLNRLREVIRHGRPGLGFDLHAVRGLFDHA